MRALFGALMAVFSTSKLVPPRELTGVQYAENFL